MCAQNGDTAISLAHSLEIKTFLLGQVTPPPPPACEYKSGDLLMAAQNKDITAVNAILLAACGADKDETDPVGALSQKSKYHEGWAGR